MRVSHGLCNRLRVLLSSIAYCELTGRRLLVYWPRTRRYRFALSSLWRHPYREIGQLGGAQRGRRRHLAEHRRAPAVVRHELEGHEAPAREEVESGAQQTAGIEVGAALHAPGGVLGVVALDGPRVEGRGQVLDDGVEERLDADVLQRGAAQHGAHEHE